MTGPGRGRLAGFDGLRALAAVLIVVLHVTSATGAVNRYTARLDIGVTVFFVISGFLLYRPFVAEHLGTRSVVSVRAFWWRRVLRIFPAYWLALTAAIVIFGSTELDSGADYIRHYLLVQIYEPAYGLAGIVPAWTLAVEVSFYAALPVYAFVLGQVTRRLPAPQRMRAEVVAALALYTLALGWRWILVSERGTDAVSARWLPAMADWFALGILLAVVHVGADLRVRVDRYALASVFAALVAFVGVCNIGLPVDGTSGTVAEDLARQVLFGAFAFFLVVPAALGGANAFVGRVLQHPVAVAAGTVSYGVFLWHFDWIEQLRDWEAFEWIASLRTLSVLAMALGLALATAAASWLLVERPMLRGRSELRRIRS